MTSPDFWNKDQAEITRLTQKHAMYQEKIGKWQDLHQRIEDIKIMAELSAEEDDKVTMSEIHQDLIHLADELRDMETRSLFSDPDDSRNAIIAINAGAGGTEAQDWVEMLFRMLTRWCENKKMDCHVIDYLPGEEAGIKSVIFTVTGPYAYGYLKSEHGIHRMVRISPFDASGRRHTSFASVSVLPEIDTDIQIEIADSDIRIDTFRASGPGGQHVNKTSSAVRITHLPTKIVVQCQNEKSQHHNRDMAMKVLKAKLYELEKSKLEKEKQDRHSSQDDIAWGSQIRSYVFNPYRLVKDHRTNVETGNLEKVMDGDIDPFIDAYLRSKAI